MTGTVTVDSRISDWVVQRVIRRVMGPLVPLTATVAALLVGAAMVWGFGGDPVEGYRAMFSGAFGGISEFADTTVKATPLLLVGIGICIAFRASVINIGGEGQIIAGALLSTVVVLALPDLPRGVLLPLALIAGAVGGACMGFIPGVLKAYANVNEILSTIMLNIVAGYMMQYLLLGPMIDKAAVEAGNHIAQTKRLSENADLPILLGDTQMNLGIVIGVAVAIAVFFLLWRTSLGYEIRAVGGSKDASRYAGMKVERRIVQALTLSGMMSGLGGAVLVFSSVAHRLSVESGPAGFTQLAGFNGIVAALFGGLHPLWTIPAAILFGGLLVGANALQRAVQVATPLVVALSGLVVVFVVSSDRAVRWARHLGERLDIGAASEDDRNESAATGAADAPAALPGEGAEP